jgi:hypothetical protein
MSKTITSQLRELVEELEAEYGPLPPKQEPMTFKEWLQEETRKCRAETDQIALSMIKGPKEPKIKSTEEEWKDLSK